MVIDEHDLDTRSVGSFFTNPVLDPDQWAELRRRLDEDPPQWPEPGGRTKTSAAWLIERAGFAKGYGRDGVAISSGCGRLLSSQRTANWVGVKPRASAWAS